MLVLSSGILWSSVSGAAIVNGDFSSGFTGWSGGTDLGIGLTAANFDASSGAAVLSSDFDLGGSFAVDLFQTFTVQSLTGASNDLFLDFDFTWNFDHVDDAWLAQLVDTTDALHTLDLTSGAGPFDITSFAGLTVELLFSLENNNGDDDTLSIDNIVVSEVITDVPEPILPLLFGTGLLALRRKLA